MTYSRSLQFHVEEHYNEFDKLFVDPVLCRLVNTLFMPSHVTELLPVNLISYKSVPPAFFFLVPLIFPSFNCPCSNIGGNWGCNKCANPFIMSWHILLERFTSSIFRFSLWTKMLERLTLAFLLCWNKPHLLPLLLLLVDVNPLRTQLSWHAFHQLCLSVPTAVQQHS